MKIRSIRYCIVDDRAAELATFFRDSLGFDERPLPQVQAFPGFAGAVFPTSADDLGWVELWGVAAGSNSYTMLQVIVDDVDLWAAEATARGMKLPPPRDAHGERIYFIKTPSGLQMSVQSPIPRKSSDGA